MTISAGARPATVNHELHPEHKLRLVNIPSSWFTCDVCQRHGEGTEHYRCEPCNFDAHADCATAPPTLKHVNYAAGNFVLYAAPDSSSQPQMYNCGLCGLELLGYRYYNREEDCRLHPCCALLPRRVVQDGRAFDLDCYPSAACGMCRKNSTSSFAYRSSYDDGEEVFLHVRCLVDTNNRLTGYQNWVASAPIRPGVLGSFARKKEGSGEGSFTAGKKEGSGDLPRASGALPATVSHVMHPEHKLRLVSTPQFNCDVCKQYGKGTAHYRCEPCDFDAHPVCATAPPTLRHVNYAGDFVLYAASAGGHQTYCAACGREALGYRYYNRDHDCRLHPCCAFLPSPVVQDGCAFDLGYHSSGTCSICRKSSASSLSYRSNQVYLHVRCLVDTNNRLTGYQDWVATAPIRPGLLAAGNFTRTEGSFTPSPRKKQDGLDNFFKAANTTVKVADLVLKVAGLDFGGVGDVVSNLGGVGDAVGCMDFDGGGGDMADAYSGE